MSDLQLKPLNDPMLKVPPNEFDDWENAENFCERLWNRQLEIGGIGLSANQVGLNARVFTMGIAKENHKWMIINPKLISVSEEVVQMEEGCLSAPGLMLKVKRPEKCTLSYQTVDKEDVIEEFDGVWARVVLHEYDHMVGQNFLMRVGPLQLKRAMERIKKQTKRLQKRNAA